MVAAQEKLAKVKRAKEAGKFDWDLKRLEQKVNQMQKVVDEEGEPPKKFLQAAARVSLHPKTTHRMGQGGLPGLKAAFVSALPSSLDSFPLLQLPSNLVVNLQCALEVEWPLLYPKPCSRP